MNQQKDIIEFEDLFKDEILKKQMQDNPERKRNYGTAIIVYLMVMFVVASVFYIIFSNIDAFVVNYTENELIFENISYDVQGLAIIDDSTYYYYIERYDEFVIEVANYDGYVIMINAQNTQYQELLMIEDDITGLYSLNEQVYLEIISENSEYLTWGDQSLIHIYAGKSQPLPNYFTADYIVIEGPVTDLNTTSSTLLNFLVYLVLLPVLLYLLKIDIVYDFNGFLLKRNQWFSIIIIGYLYLLLGNVIANYLSQFLGTLVDLAPSEAINQITIIRALSSPGAVLMILSAVVLGPIAEELIFRKSIFGLFKSDRVGWVVSSLLFGGIHLIAEASLLSALVNGLSYFVMGFVFGYIYLKNNKNIIAPTIVHMLSNLISILAILFILS